VRLSELVLAAAPTFTFNSTFTFTFNSTFIMQVQRLLQPNLAHTPRVQNARDRVCNTVYVNLEQKLADRLLHQLASKLCRAKKAQNEVSGLVQ